MGYEAVIDAFADKLIDDKGYQSLSQEMRTEVKKEIMDLAKDKIDLAIVRSVPANRHDEFSGLIDGGSDEELQQFLQKQVPNIQEVIAAALLELRAAYLR